MAARSLLNVNGGRIVLLLLLLYPVLLGVQGIQTVSFSFEENTGAHYSIGRLDTQQGSSSSSSSYEFTGDSAQVCQQYFEIVSASSEILTITNIDREAVIEETESDNITCQVSHDSNTLQVQFHILDENDIVPNISGISQGIEIYENIPIGQIVAYLMPIDTDAGLNGTVNFTITHGNEDGFFSFSVSSGQSDLSDRLLILRKSLNYETHQIFNLTLFVTDAGTPPLNKTQNLVIRVRDINDQVPTFNVDFFHFNVSENHTIGSSHPFGIIDASDGDSMVHSQIFFQLDIENSRDPQAADFFSVNTTSGELYLINKLDVDNSNKHSYEFRIEARNPGRVSGTKADITVTILDANDEVPELIPTSTTLQGIPENSPNSTFVFVFRDADTAQGDNEIGTVGVTIEPNVEHKVIILTFVATIVSITVTQPIDREWTDSLFLSVNVSDRGSPPLVSFVNLTIPIFDVNDNAPQFSLSSYEVRISSLSRPEMGVAHITAIDPDEGENGTVIYSISNVPFQDWFEINSSTGLVTLISSIDYEIIQSNGGINLTITARDNGTTPLSNTTTLYITVIPYVTFQPISYQQYNSFDLYSSPHVYMVFKTLSTNGLLFYQNYLSSFSSLEIINGYLVFERRVYSDVYVANNKWYSLLINRTKDSLDVWEGNVSSTGLRSQVEELLQTASVRECSRQQQVPSDSNNSPLYIGGVPNIFTIPDGRISSDEFTGIIANIIINDHHIDLSCPYSSHNTHQGNYFTNTTCNLCNGRSYCDPYTPSNSTCHCINGLPIETCDQEQDYGPITVDKGYVQFDLDYNFFYSSAIRKNNSLQHQTISFSFIPKNSSLIGLLFYSQTSDTIIQRLEVEQTFRYTVSANDMPKISLVSEPVNFQAGIEYTLELNLTSKTDDMTMTLYERGGKSPKFLKLNKNNFGSGDSIYYPFASQPHTTVSLGGTTNTRAISVSGQFNGCVTGFDIDNFAIPLRGLMINRQQNFTYTPERTWPFCHSCYMGATCPSNSTCHVKGEVLSNLYQCTCNDGFKNVSSMCVSLPRPSVTPILFSSPILSNIPVTDGLNTHVSSFKLYYIVVIACTAVFIVSVIIVLLAVMFRCAYTRGKKDTQRPQLVTQITYHQGNGDCCHDDKDLTDGVDVIPAPKRSNDYVRTHLIKTGGASFDENDSSLGSIHSPCSYRKSTSQETGFHTASEGPSTRSSPHRRSISKDSERYDSDFTSFETDSEELTSGIEEVMSPNEVRLVSSGSMMGVPASFRIQNPLTPHEKNLMTPLKPNSSMLLSEDETDTEVSTTTNTNRRRYYDNDSLMSEQNAPDWYKTSSPSTVVESEGETPYGSKAAALHKASSRHKHRPPSLPHIKPYKGSPHGSPYNMGYPPPPPSNGHLSNSPLIKSHRPFDYPTSATTGGPHSSHMIPPPGIYNGYLDHPIDHNRLPVIAESSFQYPHHPPYLSPPTHHINTYHQRDTSPRSPYNSAPQPPTHTYDPTHTPYYPGYQGTSLTPGGGLPTTYCDLNSFSKVNPITYWEQQQRLRPIVDQDDPLRFLTEPCRKFEDVSTTPSVAESTVIDSVVDKDSAASVPSRRPLTSRGVYSDNIVLPRTLPPHPLALPLEIDIEDEEEEEEEKRGDEEEGSITHFPSADCTPTLLSPSTSDNQQQHSLSTLDDSTQNGYHFPDYA